MKSTHNCCTLIKYKKALSSEDQQPWPGEVKALNMSRSSRKAPELLTNFTMLWVQHLDAPENLPNSVEVFCDSPCCQMSVTVVSHQLPVVTSVVSINHWWQHSLNQVFREDCELVPENMTRECVAQVLYTPHYSTLLHTPHYSTLLYTPHYSTLLYTSTLHTNPHSTISHTTRSTLHAPHYTLHTTPHYSRLFRTTPNYSTFHYTLCFRPATGSWTASVAQWSCQNQTRYRLLLQGPNLYLTSTSVWRFARPSSFSSTPSCPTQW